MPVSTTTMGLRDGLGSYRHLDRLGHGPLSPLQHFLARFAPADVYYRHDDFDMKTLNVTDFWTANGGTGATAFATPGTLADGGTAEGATGTNGTEANRAANLYGPRVFSGDKNCGMDIRLKISAITSIEFGVGFIDTHDTITTPLILSPDVDTPSFASGMGDAALVYIDTAETLATLAMITLGSGALNTGAKDAIGTVTPTAATYLRIVIQCATNTVTAWVKEGNGPRTMVSRTSAMEGGTLVRPMITISGVSATSRTYTIDYWDLWQER